MQGAVELGVEALGQRLPEHDDAHGADDDAEQREEGDDPPDEPRPEGHGLGGLIA
jgi:hypothetical protein